MLYSYNGGGGVIYTFQNEIQKFFTAIGTNIWDMQW